MTLYSAVLTLILVMDPLGNIPLFIAILSRFDHNTRTRIILRECGVALAILVLFLFFGQFILKGLHISTSSLSIGGGIILFMIAIRMIFPDGRGWQQDSQQDEPFIVPIAVPLIAGPSTIATVLLFVTRDPEHMLVWLVAIIIATVFFIAIILGGSKLMRLLGPRGLVALERLMGMILTTIAVQMFMSGITDFFKTGALHG